MTTKSILPSILMSFGLLILLSCAEKGSPKLSHLQGEMAGELTQNSVILQSRLTLGDRTVDGYVPGSRGVACFEISTDRDFIHAFRTGWMESLPANDFIIKTKVEELNPGTCYYYRLLFGGDTSSIKAGTICEFRTWPTAEVRAEVSFVVVTGMNYGKFHFGVDSTGTRAYQGRDKYLGYPALETILELNPDFFVGTGDNVYYDSPKEGRATTQMELRQKWHDQFVQPRFKTLFANVPTYWEKDDHDHRFNDCDTTGDKLPTSELGIEVFLEQLPVVDPRDTEPRTYRTHQMNKLLQIWLVEGRDYRSPNEKIDGPEKTLWGKEQRDWLKQTLLASDAVFKILISPTPMIGPDDGYKSDNHTNPKGFRHEGNEFFKWLRANGFLNKNFYIVCGDRHWQYHSVHPLGFEEFSSGALVDANSRLGRRPGDPESTDPEAAITQIYLQEEKSGGFLKVAVKPGIGARRDSIIFTFSDEKGVVLYKTSKAASPTIEVPELIEAYD